MKNVFLRLKERNLIEPVPGRKGAASAWQQKRQTSQVNIDFNEIKPR